MLRYFDLFVMLMVDSSAKSFC